MEGVDWDRGGHSFTIATKRYRRLLQEHKAAEREREKKRDRSQRQRSKDDGAAQRKRKRRAEQVAAAAEQLPLVKCSFAIAPSTDGRVQLRVQPSFKWEAKYLPKRGQEAWRPSVAFTWSVRWNELNKCAVARARASRAQMLFCLLSHAKLLFTCIRPGDAKKRTLLCSRPDVLFNPGLVRRPDWESLGVPSGISFPLEEHDIINPGAKGACLIQHYELLNEMRSAEDVYKKNQRVCATSALPLVPCH